MKGTDNRKYLLLIGIITIYVFFMNVIIIIIIVVSEDKYSFHSKTIFSLLIDFDLKCNVLVNVFV